MKLTDLVNVYTGFLNRTLYKYGMPTNNSLEYLYVKKNTIGQKCDRLALKLTAIIDWYKGIRGLTVW